MSTPNAPENPEHGTPGSEATTATKSRTGLWVGIVIAAVVVIGLVIAAVAGAFSGKPDASASPSASASASETASAAPSETPSATPSESASATTEPTTPAGATVPQDCNAVFTPAFLQKIANNEDYPLNDSTVGKETSRDPKLLALINTLEPRITCTWGRASFSGAGTTVAAVTPAQATEVATLMRAQGGTCTEVNGGTRCAFNSVKPENPQYDEYAGVVESTFTRDGLLISTEQVNFLAEDYLKDSITAIFGS